MVHRLVAQDLAKPGESAIFPPEVSQHILIRGRTEIHPWVKDIRKLAHLSEEVTVAAEVKAYLQNIVTFLRMHRAVEGGISPRATRHFDLLVKYNSPTIFPFHSDTHVIFRCLAPLHQLDYVTPSIVALAARKIYPHRITITAPEDERSMQYGSQLAAVAALLDGVTPEHIIEEVLESVEAPL